MLSYISLKSHHSISVRWGVLNQGVLVARLSVRLFGNSAAAAARRLLPWPRLRIPQCSTPGCLFAAVFALCNECCRFPCLPTGIQKSACLNCTRRSPRGSLLQSQRRPAITAAAAAAAPVQIAIEPITRPLHEAALASPNPKSDQS